MRIDILTLFPGMFAGPFQESIIKRAQERGLVSVHLHDIRDYTKDRHHVVDDYPYGGGAGMVMKPEPVNAALEAVRRSAGGDEWAEGPGRPAVSGQRAGDEGRNPGRDGPLVILMTPQGEVFTQRIAQELAGEPWLALLCGHYEGVDERIRQHIVDREISIGDYVLTGGEVPAMVVTDAVVRLLPGVMGSSLSAEEESFSQDLLEYPQYTRPAEFMGWTVPDVLLSGNHGAVAKWRRQQAILRTARRRPELLEGVDLTAAEREWLARALSGDSGEAPTNLDLG